MGFTHQLRLPLASCCTPDGIPSNEKGHYLVITQLLEESDDSNGPVEFFKVSHKHGHRVVSIEVLAPGMSLVSLGRKIQGLIPGSCDTSSKTFSTHPTKAFVHINEKSKASCSLPQYHNQKTGRLPKMPLIYGRCGSQLLETSPHRVRRLVANVTLAWE